MGLHYDVIGDIHGQADKLERLLRRLGYRRQGAGWRPPAGHQAIFVGDLIDRGPDQIGVYRQVRAMVDAGHAQCILGNHELNAIGYRTIDTERPDRHLRARTEQHTRQHGAYLAQVGLDTPLDIEIIDWFRTLPFYLDLDGIRVVHAWWRDDHIDAITRARPDGRLLDAPTMQQLYLKGSPPRVAIEALTKGEELDLPPGIAVIDQGGDSRTTIRTRWWDTRPKTYRDMAMIEPGQRERIPAIALPADYRPSPPEGSPVFVGHYWMTGRPGILTPRLSCVDYSAARAGPLVAYRWTGEPLLDDRRFVSSEDA